MITIQFNMKKTNTILAIFVISSTLAFAQNEVDALRYSENTTLGTARFTAMGGAFGALGGDMSSIHFNPAGIGIYRSSELTFSPSLIMNNTNSNHFGTVSRATKASLKLTNIGIVLADVKSQAAGWEATQIGFTYRKSNHFSNRLNISGINPNTSLLESYSSSIEGLNSSDINSSHAFGAGLAWNTYLINPIDTIDTTTYISIAPHGGTNQEKFIQKKGGVNDFSLTIGANYKNKIFIGGSMGFPYVNYKEEATYTESDINDTISYLNSFTLNEGFHTYGTGINIKLGVIIKPVDWLRIGGAFHSPTYFKLTDQYSSSISAQFDSIPLYSTQTTTSYASNSPEGVFDYSIATPMRLMSSMACIIGKKGLISLDYEWADYSSALLESNNYGFTSANAAINSKYTSASTLRLGTEWRLLPFSFRAGYVSQESPYANLGSRGSLQSYSFGFGIREQYFFFDLAYVYTITQENYYLYDIQSLQPTTNTIESNQLITTIGLRF